MRLLAQQRHERIKGQQLPAEAFDRQALELLAVLQGAELAA